MNDEIEVTDPTHTDLSAEIVQFHAPEDDIRIRGPKTVVWTGKARDYWDNMEAIHHAIAQEFAGDSSTETD